MTRPKTLTGENRGQAEARKRLRDHIQYQLEEIPKGARIRVTTKDQEPLGAVVEFLRFQISGRHTDSLDVSKLPKWPQWPRGGL